MTISGSQYKQIETVHEANGVHYPKTGSMAKHNTLAELCMFLGLRCCLLSLHLCHTSLSCQCTTVPPTQCLNSHS